MLGLDSAVDSIRIDESIELLEQHIGGNEIRPLIDVLKAVSDNPYDQKRLEQLSEEFKKLGPMQGAILTYAPYISMIVEDDPFGDLDFDPFEEDPQ